MHTSKFYATAMLVGLSTSIVLAEPDNDVIEDEVLAVEVDTLATMDPTYILDLDSAFQAGDINAGLELSRNYCYDEDWGNYRRIISRLAAMGSDRGRVLSFLDYLSDRDYDRADSVIGAIGSGNALYTYALKDYLNETKTHYDEAQAARRTLAVNPGDTAANYRMGQFFYFNDTEENVDSALHYYLKAAEKGHPAAAHMAGSIYFNILPELDPDFVNTKRWFTKSAELGCPDGIFCLGVLYDEGIVYPHDTKKALEYYERAAAMNQPNATYNLGTAYLYKTYGVRDIDKAVELLTKADALGHPTAAKALGMAYSSDWFMPRDMEKAQYFLERGARKGNSECLDWLSRICLSGPKPSLENAKEYAEQYEALTGDQPIEYKYIRQPLTEAYIDQGTELFQKAKTGDPEALDAIARFRLYDIGAFYSNKEKLEAIEKSIDAEGEFVQYDYVRLMFNQPYPDYQQILEFCEQRPDKDFSEEIDRCREALNLKKDLKQIEKDAKKGNAEALYRYGRAVELGLVDGKTNNRWAQTIYIDAAGKGHIKALEQLLQVLDTNSTRQYQYWSEKLTEADSGAQ